MPTRCEALNHAQPNKHDCGEFDARDIREAVMPASQHKYRTMAVVGETELNVMHDFKRTLGALPVYSPDPVQQVVESTQVTSLCRDHLPIG